MNVDIKNSKGENYGSFAQSNRHKYVGVCNGCGQHASLVSA